MYLRKPTPSVCRYVKVTRKHQTLTLCHTKRALYNVIRALCHTKREAYIYVIGKENLEFDHATPNNNPRPL